MHQRSANHAVHESESNTFDAFQVPDRTITRQVCIVQPLLPIVHSGFHEHLLLGIFGQAYSASFVSRPRFYHQ
jgi:hypothetical protein